MLEERLKARFAITIKEIKLKIELTGIIDEIGHTITDAVTQEDLEKIASKASHSFLRVLTSEEVEICVLNALWKAAEKYDASSGCKFTTYFYNGVVMECLSQKKFNLNNTNSKIYENILSANNKNVDTIDMLDEIDASCDDPSLIYDRFYKNMSVREIALARGVCSESIRIKINKNLAKLERKLTKIGV